jgi:hypothetical protein
MNRDLAGLIERNLLGASDGALRPRRPSRFEPAAIDGQPPAALESAYTIVSASPIHSTVATRMDITVRLVRMFRSSRERHAVPVARSRMDLT